MDGEGDWRGEVDQACMDDKKKVSLKKKENAIREGKVAEPGETLKRVFTHKY